MICGCARVSTDGQSVAAQVAALTAEFERESTGQDAMSDFRRWIEQRNPSA